MITALQNLFAASSSGIVQTGTAFNIRCTPDLFTGESFNVGVCVIGTRGERYARVISEPGRLACIYGEDAAHGVVQLAQIAFCEALEGRASPSPNIVFDTPTPIYSLPPLEALDELFVSQVTAAIPLRNDSSARLKTTPTSKVISTIYRLLREKRPEEADEIIPSSPQTVVSTRKGKRAVAIALQPPNGGGVIESAAFGADTIRFHLLDALLDLEWAAEARGLDRLGFFVLRPTGWPENKLHEAEKAIDYVIDRIPTRCRVEVEEDPEVLAERIIDWAWFKRAA
ncbi:hypothetical protein GPA19_05440 [Azoarcus indigens]|uniref:DUF3037 family protein n=1 Tax=Azoarcus indigens TaxID=29545 RepID=A0A4R6DVF1_9RHOO|nr:hypothetical protein [Azoarcus indigens]NMG64389.1 hypothetical protein [Azoarcus indigens]TDN49157.1 hypothetical protein C7389_1128 [Azoarcus indigens]